MEGNQDLYMKVIKTSTDLLLYNCILIHCNIFYIFLSIVLVEKQAVFLPNTSDLCRVDHSP